MSKIKIRPTESELEILLILWEHGPSSVRFVNDILNKSRETGYTTTLKLMQIMNDKKLTIRDTAQRTHIYQANVSEEETKNNLLKTFMDATFKGSAMKLVMQALGSHNTTPEELEEIKAFIKKIETKK